MKYYIQRAESGYVGNCLLWWKKEGHGYGCNITDAEVFDGENQKFLDIIKDKKYRAWPKDYIDQCATLHVDHQNLNLDMSSNPDTKMKEVI